MSRYLFTYSGQSEMPAEHLEHIQKHGQVVDRTMRTLLVDAEPAQVTQLAPALPGWKIEPEQILPVPDPRKRIKKPLAGP
jgi:hypothetical protein